MRAIKALGVSIAAVVLTGSAAMAKVDQVKASSGAVTPLPKASQLADNVVVTPQGTTAPAPAPAAPATVNVQPAPEVQPVQPVVTPTNHTVVTQDNPHNYVATIFVSALLGGIGGALIGGAIYYLDTPREHPYNIGYWAAGGVLVGTGIGIINVVADESRSERAVSSNHLPTDPVPTFRVALLNRSF